LYKIIKISCAGSTKSWSNQRNPMIFKFLPGYKNIWKNCQFFWNDDQIKKADYWFIVGDVDLDEEVCEVDPRNVILTTGEPQSIKRYDDSPEFIKQFGRVFSSQHDLKHPNLFALKPPINWWIDGGSPIKSKEEFQNWDGGGLGYDDFKNLREVEKNKLLSVFCSAKIFTKGHKARFNFCQKLKNHFRDKIDWYGAGVRPIDNKFDGIAPYKYHVTLENSRGPNYWTEKLMDPLMVLTHPIYCGATNIDEYFSRDQITEIDIKYPKTAIAKIEKLIAENFYENHLENLIEARDLVMDKYNFFAQFYEITKNDAKIASSKDNKRLIKIQKEQFFYCKIPTSPTKSRNNLFQRIKKSLIKKITAVKNFSIDCLLFLKLKINYRND